MVTIQVLKQPYSDRNHWMDSEHFSGWICKQLLYIALNEAQLKSQYCVSMWFLIIKYGLKANLASA